MGTHTADESVLGRNGMVAHYGCEFPARSQLHTARTIRLRLNPEGLKSYALAMQL